MQQTKEQAPIVKVIAAFAIVYIVWGSTYFFIQASEVSFPPFLLGAIRFSASGLILLAWCGIKKEKLLNKPQLKSAFITGNLLLFLANGSIIWAEQVLPSSFVAVLVSATPLWIVLFDKRNFKSNFSNIKIIIGIITGFAGVVLLFGEKVMESLHDANKELLIINLIVVVAGNMCWAIGSLYAKYNSVGNVMVSSAWQMIAAAVSFTIITLCNGEAIHFNWATVQNSAWASVLYLVIMGSLLGYSAYVWLLEVRPATQVSTNAYVNPVVAVLLGVLFASEKISGLQMIALAIVLSSVFIINLDKYKKTKK